MPSRRAVALLLASTSLLALSACTSGAPTPDDTAAVTAPQADISGEWVVTRTVSASNDTTNPARAVGATSVRYVLVDRDDCDEALCPGTVSSGAAVDARENTELTQTDGGFEYTFTGALDCMNSTTGGVLFVDGFDYTQTAKLTVGQATDVEGQATASTLTGNLEYTDTGTAAALDAGCTRDPLSVAVSYTVTAVRAPVA
jgi:hypothetical protein